MARGANTARKAKQPKASRDGAANGHDKPSKVEAGESVGQCEESKQTEGFNFGQKPVKSEESSSFASVADESRMKKKRSKSNSADVINEKRPKNEPGEWTEPHGNFNFGQRETKANRHDGDEERVATTVSQEVINLRSYLQSCVDGADDTTAKEVDSVTLVENLAEDMKASLFDICCDRDCSRLVEELLSRGQFCLLALKLLQSLLEMKRDRIVEILCHPCGSRVAEKMITVSSQVVFDSKVKSTAEANWKGLAIGLLVQLNEEVVVDSVETLITEMYGSHVVRTLGKVFSGDINVKPGGSAYPVGEEFRQAFHSLAGKILNWTSISTQTTLWIDSVSLVLQDFVKLDGRLKSGSFHQFLKDSAKDATAVPTMWQDKHMSRVWEVAVGSCTENERKGIFKKCLSGDALMAVVRDPFANFVLQRFLDAVETVDVAAEILTQLIPQIPQLLQLKRVGIIVAMFGVCRRFKTNQSEVVKSFKEALLPESKEKESFAKIFRCFSAVKPSTSDDKVETLAITGPGSMIIQHALYFDKPGLMLKGVEAMAEADCLMQIATNVCGSHIVDAVFQSPAVMKKGKVMLFGKFHGHWVSLACDKFGSRVLETIWEWCDQTRRETIAAELCKSQAVLLGNKFGRIIWFKYGLDTYKRAPQQWHGFLQRKESKQKLLKNFLE